MPAGAQQTSADVALPSQVAGPWWEQLWPLALIGIWVVASVAFLLILLAITVVLVKWARTRLRRLLPAGIAPVAFTWPLGTVGLIGVVATLVALLLRARTVDVPTIIVGVGGSLIATAIAAMFLAGRERTLARISDAGLVYIWSNRRGRAPKGQEAINWIDEIYKAKTFCILLGTSLSGYSVHDRASFQRVVMALVGSVIFRLLLLDPDSPAADIREDEEERLGEHTKLRIWTSIEALLDLRAEIPLDKRAKFELYVYRDIPTFALSWVDGYMIVTHYLPGIKNANSPAYALWDLHPFKEKEGQLYHMFEENMGEIMKRAKAINDANEREYREQSRRYREEHERAVHKVDRSGSGANGT